MRELFVRPRLATLLGAVLLMAMLTAGCADGPRTFTSDPTLLGDRATTDLHRVYRLGTRDRVSIEVFGERDLSGEFPIGGAGTVYMPLVGEVPAQGMTLRELEQAVGDKLVERGLLQSPEVTVSVTNFRPYYLTGEVRSAGEHPYKEGMNLQTAIIAGGGFTQFADQRRVFIQREGSLEEVEYPMTAAIPVLPGDVIRIPMRYF